MVSFRIPTTRSPAWKRTSWWTPVHPRCPANRVQYSPAKSSRRMRAATPTRPCSRSPNGGSSTTCLSPLADVTDKFNGWSEGKDILPDLVKNAQLDGKQYGVPWYAGVRAVYYRTDWFAEAGVKPPTNWDEMVAAAKTVQAKKPGTYGIALPGNSELPFYSFLWSAGAEIATKRLAKS